MVNSEKKWKQMPNSEIPRLAQNLNKHLKKMKINSTRTERIDKVKCILKDQKFTCAFGGDGMYCWNHIRNGDLNYLKLEWGHKIPSSLGKVAQVESNLILLCARCNNQLQTSSTIEDLILELEHKIKFLKKILE